MCIWRKVLHKFDKQTNKNKCWYKWSFIWDYQGISPISLFLMQRMQELSFDLFVNSVKGKVEGKSRQMEGKRESYVGCVWYSCQSPGLLARKIHRLPEEVFMLESVVSLAVVLGPMGSILPPELASPVGQATASIDLSLGLGQTFDWINRVAGRLFSPIDKNQFLGLSLDILLLVFRAWQRKIIILALCDNRPLATGGFPTACPIPGICQPLWPGAGDRVG